MIRAIAKADAEELAFWDRTIAKGRQDDGDLERALAILAKHGTMNSTRDTAMECAGNAKASLDSLPDQALKSMLIDLADYVVARIN